MSVKKLAIITTHPIQYNAPLFQLLAGRKNIYIKVFYTWGETAQKNKFDPGFKKVILWDVPLLDGYESEFLKNTATDRGTHRFMGIINPDAVKRIDAFNPDSILVFGWSFQSHLRLLRYYYKKKVILFRGDSTLLDETFILRRQMRLLFLRWVYKHINYALYVGRNNREYFKKMGLKNENLIFAPHAIDNNRFSSQSEIHQQRALRIRDEMGIKGAEVVFLFAGKLEDVKNIPILLNAFVASKLYKKAHLVIVGNGVLEDELKMRFLGIPTVHFMDFQNQLQMPIVYRIADVFILPSWSETWGLSVNEAMACGIPVIVSDHCGCAPDLVIPGENGYIFKSGDIDDLIRKMLLLYNGKSALKRMGQVSLKHVSQYSFEHICNAVEKIVNLK